MSSDSWSGIFSRQRWAEWWARRRQGQRQPLQERPGGIERRKSEHLSRDLIAHCKEISILGSDAWPALVRDMSLGGIGLLIVQPFPPGTFLGVQLQQANGTLGCKLLVKVVHASRQKGTNSWVLGCEVLRELPAPTQPLPGSNPEVRD